VGQLIRPKSEQRQHGGISAIGEMIRQALAQANLYQTEGMSLLMEVGGMKRRTAKRAEYFAHGVLGQFRQIPDWRPVTQIEPSDGLARDQIRRRKRRAASRGRVPWKTPPRTCTHWRATTRGAVVLRERARARSLNR
jgi:hypothetical protein